MKGWSQEGDVEFFWTEVENLCGGSSICMTHTGFMLPAEHTDTGPRIKTKGPLSVLPVASQETHGVKPCHGDLWE